MMNYPPKHNAEKKKAPSSALLPVLFFPLAILYHELLLQIFNTKTDLWSMALVYLLLFSLAAGFALCFLVTLLPAKAGRITAIVLSALWTILVIAQYCCKDFYTTYFPLGFMLGMVGDVAGDFGGDAVDVVVHRLPVIALILVPLVLTIGLRKLVIPGKKVHKDFLIALAVVAVLCQLTGSLMGSHGKDKALYTYNFTADESIPKFGLVTELRLEAEYALFGLPTPPAIDISDQDDGQSAAPQEEAPVVYGFNKQDIDFDAVASNSTLADMASYFNSLTPTQQNEHTGMFRGKNLIIITAEGFSGLVISPELTPTLYRLSHEGFYFTNYYQPGWGQSTTGGEYSVLTGLIPTWLRGGTTTSFYAGKDNAYPYTMANQLGKLGYTTIAYHNGSYDYYNRNLTHPGLGYDEFYGLGNGLEQLMTTGSDNCWPASDTEMIDVTADTYINDYVQNGKPFHAYYMTISGHAYYGWGHRIAKLYQDVAVSAYPEASTVTQAYIATQLELEAAVKCLVDKLEAAGIADDTVICLSADHYPYAMTTEGSDPYYSELSGLEDTDASTTRYKNTLILWCGGMEREQVDIPCTAIDILPTLSNLFGLTYDSRLLSGRDIFAENYSGDQLSTAMPLAILPTTAGKGWRTLAGTYEPRTGVFTAEPGHTVSDDYVDTINAIIAAKYSYAAKIVENDYYRLLGL